MYGRMEFARRLRAIRLERNITQQDLCERVGISPVAISSYEKGIRFPKTETLVKIAAALQVSVKDLMGVDLQKMSNEESAKAFAELQEPPRPISAVLNRDRPRGYGTRARQLVREVVYKDYARDFVRDLSNFLEFDRKEGATLNVITIDNRIEAMSREDYFDFLFAKLQKSLLELKTNYDENKTIRKEE